MTSLLPVALAAIVAVPATEPGAPTLDDGDAADPLPPIATPTAPPAPAPSPTLGPGPAAGGPKRPRAPAGITMALSFTRQYAAGNAVPGYAMADFTGPMSGGGLEWGWRPAPEFVLGAFLDFVEGAPGPRLAGWCESRALVCSANDMRMGLFGRYVLTPTAGQTAWFGLGIAFDELLAIESDFAEGTPGFDGGEFLRLSVGWDWRARGWLGLGAFVTASPSRYSELIDTAGDPVPIDDPTVHVWIHGGVRAILFP